MSDNFISTGLEPEFFANEAAKIETAGPGIVRVYWAALYGPELRLVYTQTIAECMLPRASKALLFVPPRNAITRIGYRFTDETPH